MAVVNPPRPGTTELLALENYLNDLPPHPPSVNNARWINDKIRKTLNFINYPWWHARPSKAILEQAAVLLGDCTKVVRLLCSLRVDSCCRSWKTTQDADVRAVLYRLLQSACDTLDVWTIPEDFKAWPSSQPYVLHKGPVFKRWGVMMHLTFDSMGNFEGYLVEKFGWDAVAQADQLMRRGYETRALTARQYALRNLREERRPVRWARYGWPEYLTLLRQTYDQERRSVSRYLFWHSQALLRRGPVTVHAGTRVMKRTFKKEQGWVVSDGQRTRFVPHQSDLSLQKVVIKVTQWWRRRDQEAREAFFAYGDYLKGNIFTHGTVPRFSFKDAKRAKCCDDGIISWVKPRHIGLDKTVDGPTMLKNLKNAYVRIIVRKGFQHDMRVLVWC